MQQDVNYIEHLKNVNSRFYDDKLITSSHVAVYNSLFQFWNKSFFDTDLSINRDSVMKQAKIGSVNTYLKCLKELEIQGYLKYNPSHNPLIGSIVNLFRFDTTPDIVVIKSDTSSDTTLDKALIPYINIQTLKQETLKLINDNASLVDECLKDWIRLGKQNSKQIKNKYGEFQNVLLTDVEYNNAKEKYKHLLPKMIKKLDEYIASKGTKYKSHYATFSSWVHDSVVEDMKRNTQSSAHNNHGIPVN